MQCKPWENLHQFTLNNENWLHGLAKDIWIELLKDGDPEDNEAVFDDDEDGFIKTMEQYYILQFFPSTDAKTLQQRAMANYKFKFKRGTEVAGHMIQFRTILKYADRLPGDNYVQDFDSKLTTFDSLPKAWK